MNPLTSLRPTMPAALQQVHSQLRANETGFPANIPAAELQQLPGANASQATSATKDNFSDMLGQFVRDVNAKQAAAGDAVNGVLSGQGVPLHQAMVAMEEASVSFQMMVEVRNKLLESYQELMRMQI